MTLWYSIFAGCQRVFATTESITAAVLNRAPQPRISTPLLLATRAGVSARASSTLTCMPLYFDYIRSLKRNSLRHHPPQLMNHDLAREGRDFFIWKIEISEGLTRSEYECMRNMVEHKLNQDASSSSREDIFETRQRYPARFGARTEAPSSPIQHKAFVRVVATYDTDVDDDVPTECGLCFSWPANEDPVATYSDLRLMDDRLISLWKAMPLLDALQRVESAPTSALAPDNTRS